MKQTCPLCGARALVHRQGEYVMYPPPEVPGGPLKVPDATWEACEACQEEILPDTLTAALEALRVERLGYLRPDEIRAVRERAGLTQTRMAQFVGAGAKTYCRWEAGRSLQNRSSDNLIRLADQFPELFAQLEAGRDPRRLERIDAYLAGLAQGKGDNAHGLAMAAHGHDLDASLAAELRRRLRALAGEEE